MSVQVVAELGGTHGGNLDTALHLMDVAKEAGCDYVKFQKRDPYLSVPESQKAQMKSTPWGEMTYLAYRERMEFGEREYGEIDSYSRAIGLPWFASAWDIDSAEFLVSYHPLLVKVPSAKLTDDNLLRFLSMVDADIILSTGMSTMEEIRHAVSLCRPSVIMHCTSTYPCPPEELNLRCIPMLREAFPDIGIGYSGHEVGLPTTIAAVALGATWIERHVTLDRSSWGTDHAASIEPMGLKRLVNHIRTVEQAMGDGIKKVESGEWEPMSRLRGVTV